MTKHRVSESEARDEPLVPDELLAARDRVAAGRARARLALGRGQSRRRVLPQIAVISAIVATFGLTDRFVQGVSSQPASHAASPLAGATTTSSTAQALAQVSRTLAADQRVIASLATAQARLVQRASNDGGGAPGGSSIQLPSLPSLGSIPSIAIPTISAPPVAATTGASVVVP